MPLFNQVSSLACSSFALPCQNAHRRGYSVGEIGVDPELLPSRESDRSIQNGEARGELTEVTLRAYAFLTRVIRACASYIRRKNVKKMCAY